MNVNIHGNNISQRKSNRNKPSAKAGKVIINKDLLQRLRILLYWDLTRGRDRETEIQRQAHIHLIRNKDS